MPFTNPFARTTFLAKYSLDGQESWEQMCHRVVDNVVADRLSTEVKNRILKLMVERKFIPAGRYLYAAGRGYKQVNNCFLFRAEDSREGWADLQHKASMALMSGGGIGADYSAVRPRGSIITRTGGQASGPCSLMNMVNESGRYIMNGGQRRAAIWAGLNWAHEDIQEFMTLKDHSQIFKDAKEKDLTFPLPMELTNISVIYDTQFFGDIESDDYATRNAAWEIFRFNCQQAFSNAEPGMSFNYGKDLESLRNACTEVTSEDDSDKCNLGTLWMNRFTDQLEWKQAIGDATAFLLCGGIYSDIPTDKIREVGAKNNRIGLGLGGMHEWLMQRGSKYEVTEEMHKWLYMYKHYSDIAAWHWSGELHVEMPKGVRAMAPNGTIGIIAETTTSIEPLFCAAYKRRYFKDGKWHFQAVVDGAVKRLVAQGVKPEDIQDAYSISFEDRVKFQADVQDYVDMAISSTCNMPMWGSLENNEMTIDENARILLKYAKRLRGFTCYPNGCRSGQPLTKMDLTEALNLEGAVFIEEVQECTNGVCSL